VLVQAIAEKTGHKVAVPAIVVEESVAMFYRELRKEWDKANTAAKTLARYFPGYHIQEPDLVKRAEQWRADLQRSFTPLDAPPGAADEALRREAHRTAPTRPTGPKGSGSGARRADLAHRPRRSPTRAGERCDLLRHKQLSRLR
jgi:hypothetical protein